MISRYEVTLNNKSLGNLITRKVKYIDNKGKEQTRTEYPLLVLDVAYSGIQYQTKMHAVAGLDGYEIADKYAQRQTVTVSFELHLYDTAARNAACQKVIEWAKDGGTLKINDRTNQYLRVRCESFPVINSVKHWTDPLTVVFATEAIPFWRSEKPISLAPGSGTGPSGYLKMDGNAGKTLVTASIKANEKITSLQIACGATKLVFKGFTMAKNDVMSITYTNDRYLSVKVGNNSFLKYLQSGSSDRLLATCGVSNKVVVSADKKVTPTLSAEGLGL